MKLIKSSFVIQSLWVFCLLFCHNPSIHAQINFLTDVETRKSFQMERSYDVLSQFDTVCYAPLLIYGLYGKNGNLGIIDHHGNEITKANYHSIDGIERRHDGPSHGIYDHFVVRKGELSGLIKNTGELVSPLDSGKVSIETYLIDTIAHVNCVQKFIRSTRYKITEIFIDQEKRNEIILTDDDYEEISLETYDGTFEFQIETLRDNSLSRGPTNIGRNPKKALNPAPVSHSIFGKKYAHFSENHYIYENPKTGLFGIANIVTQKMVVPHQYTTLCHLMYFHSNLFIFEENEKRGLMDQEFNVLLPAKWDEVRFFKGHYAVRDGKFFAVLDSTFKRISGFKYQYTLPTNHIMNYVSTVLDKRGNEVLLNYLGEEVLNFDFKNYMVVVSKKQEAPSIVIEMEKGFQLLDIHGKPLLDEIFYSIVPNCCVSAEEGNVYKPWDSFPSSNNTGFYVKNDGMYGFIDANMKLIIPPRYLAMGESYYEELLYVRESNGWGVINKNTGEIVLPLNFIKCPVGTNGLIQTVNDQGYMYWNRNGELLIGPVEKAKYLSSPFPGLFRITGPDEGAIYFDKNGGSMTSTDTH